MPTDDISGIRLFDGLTQAQIAWVKARLHTRDFPLGAELVIEGEPGEVVYFILEGTVKVYLPQLDGSQVTVNIQGPGDMVGELSAIDHAGRSASVITLETTRTTWMTSADFLDTLYTIPAANQALLRVLAGQVRRTTALIRAYATLDVPGRIARQLLLLAETHGRPTPSGLLIPMRLPQGDIAELVGSSRKRTNQVMVSLRRDRVLSFDNEGHITLHKLDKLEEMVT
jgi:CRP/FNR family cyclic AMP-dependent transcriptional regulator